MKKNGNPKKTKQAKEAIVRLSALPVDALALRVYLEKHTGFGTRRHSSDPWGFVREFVRRYTEGVDAQTVIEILESQGLQDDSSTGRWLLMFDELIP